MSAHTKWKKYQTGIIRHKQYSGSVKRELSDCEVLNALVAHLFYCRNSPPSFGVVHTALINSKLYDHSAKFLFFLKKWLNMPMSIKFHGLPKPIGEFG